METIGSQSSVKVLPNNEEEKIKKYNWDLLAVEGRHTHIYLNFLMGGMGGKHDTHLKQTHTHTYTYTHIHTYIFQHIYISTHI
jgi:hypothetical protein